MQAQTPAPRNGSAAAVSVATRMPLGLRRRRRASRYTQRAEASQIAAKQIGPTSCR